MILFEWDDDKDRANAAKHGVRFADAKDVFSDPFALELLDDRYDYGEERFILIGRARDALLTVIYAERDENWIRIISARRATRIEADAYFQANR